MSSEHEPDDRELEEFLSGKSPLSTAYRDASREVAPSKLDAPILEAAKAVVRQPAPRAVRRPAWMRPFAFAATFVLSLSVLLSVWREPALRNEVVPGDEAAPPAALEAEIQAGPAPAAVPAPSADTALQDAPVERKADSALAKPKRETSSQERDAHELKKEAESERQYQFYRQLEEGEAIGTDDDRAKVEARSAAKAAPIQSEPPTREAYRSLEQKSADRDSQMLQSSPAAASREDASQDLRPALDRNEERDVQNWVVRIRALRDRGDLDGARRELEALQKAYPAFEVPPDLRRLEPE